MLVVSVIPHALHPCEESNQHGSGVTADPSNASVINWLKDELSQHDTS